LVLASSVCREQILFPRDSHSSSLLEQQPFVGVEQASASIEEETA
jgi:hypothetical protein